MKKALSSVKNHPAFAAGIQRLEGAEDFKKYTWQFSGDLTGFKGYYNRFAGYAHSSDAMKGLWDHISARGVRSILGEKKGKAERLVYSYESGKVVGVITADGKTHDADLVICALGAHGASLIPEMGKTAVARTWPVVHVQLTEKECDLLRGIPTTNIRDLGFFFEPDRKTRLFKMCHLGSGYANTGKNGVSLPPGGDMLSRPPCQDFVPKVDDEKLRKLLRETFPWMADRPFVNNKLCWFSDTADSNYCIDFVPGSDGSLVALGGDSGHGFKIIPIFGKWVADLIEVGRQNEKRWQWRNSDGNRSKWGESVSWRVGEGAELRDLVEQKDSSSYKAKL